MADFDTDLFVIGAGSGGVRAGRIAAGYGARVMVAEEFRVGGTCVIRGCVPKKLLVYASRFPSEFEDAVGFGWTVPEASFDWATLRDAKDREIDRLERAYVANLERSGATILRTRATVAGPNTVRLSDGRTVTAGHILVATGAWPFLPPSVPGIEHAITSNEVFDLPALPKHVTIVGGGYIAVEFAGVFNGLGVDTTLVYRGERILRGFDGEIVDRLTEALRRRGIRILTTSDVAAIAPSQAGAVATLSTGESLPPGLVMYATGRLPNTRGLGLEEAGVALDAVGAVRVDGHSRSSVPSIYAVGDVTNRVNLTPVAIREGMPSPTPYSAGGRWSLTMR